MQYRNIEINSDNISGEKSYDGNRWYGFSGSITMMKIYEHWTNPKVYKYSDGYGSEGYIPSQGMDWSGCRDSSDTAIEKMLKASEMINKNKPWPWEKERICV